MVGADLLLLYVPHVSPRLGILLTIVALVIAIKFTNTYPKRLKARAAEQELRRNMYHNTQIMLKHYRDIVWALECFPSEIAEELEAPLKDLDALLSVVDTQVALGNAKLEHRLLSVRKSRLLLDRINDALTVLRNKPGNGELMYNIIFQTFITPDKLTHSDILYRLDISERHSRRSTFSRSGYGQRQWVALTPGWRF